MFKEAASQPCDERTKPCGLGFLFQREGLKCYLGCTDDVCFVLVPEPNPGAGPQADFLTNPAWPSIGHAWLFKVKAELN